MHGRVAKDPLFISLRCSASLPGMRLWTTPGSASMHPGLAMNPASSVLNQPVQEVQLLLLCAQECKPPSGLTSALNSQCLALASDETKQVPKRALSLVSLHFQSDPSGLGESACACRSPTQMAIPWIPRSCTSISRLWPWQRRATRLRTRMTGWHLQGCTTESAYSAAPEDVETKESKESSPSPGVLLGWGFETSTMLFSAKEDAGKHHPVRGWDDFGLRGLLGS